MPPAHPRDTRSDGYSVFTLGLRECYTGPAKQASKERG